MRHLLKLYDLDKAELLEILELAQTLKEQHKTHSENPSLKHKVVGLVFEKPSTRTRVSFEAGIYHLQGHAVVMTAQGSQIARGEPTEDTAKVMGRYCDMLMVRTFSQKIVEDYAQYAGVPIINGLTDLAHPCQLLADLLTVKEKGCNLEDMTVAWVGDGNNMANSWIAAAGLLGFRLKLAVPQTKTPDQGFLDQAKKLGNLSIEVGHDPKWAANEADVVATDVWASMGQENEQEARKAMFAGFTVSTELMQKAAPNALALHCLPAHRGEEITDEIMKNHPEIFDEAENRLHAQKGLMVWLMDNINQG